MAKFVIVSKAPSELRKDEWVIDYPTFMEQIKENARHSGRGNLTGQNQLRYIAGAIGAKYDEQLTAWTIKPHQYIGRPYADDEELSNIIVEMLRDQYPQIFSSYVAHQVKARPSGTKLIYFIGGLSDATAFFQDGIDLIDEKEVDVALGLKPKKVVGKPALTKEEAEERNSQ